MRIIYEEQDTVEFRGQYWRVMSVTGYNSVYIRNSVGAEVNDVPIDQIKPTPASIKSAICSVERSYYD